MFCLVLKNWILIQVDLLKSGIANPKKLRFFPEKLREKSNYDRNPLFEKLNTKTRNSSPSLRLRNWRRIAQLEKILCQTGKKTLPFMFTHRGRCFEPQLALKWSKSNGYPYSRILQAHSHHDVSDFKIGNNSNVLFHVKQNIKRWNVTRAYLFFRIKAEKLIFWNSNGGGKKVGVSCSFFSSSFPMFVQCHLFDEEERFPSVITKTNVYVIGICVHVSILFQFLYT